MDFSELKPLIEAQGKAFEAFKEANDANSKKRDAVLEEKLAKIETSLDAAVEAKAAIEARLNAEKKEREELELRIQRDGLRGGGDEKFEAELKAFNLVLSGHAAERKQAAPNLSADEYREYKSAYGDFLRKDNRLLTPDQVKTLSVGSDADGGYLVTPDMSGRIATKIFETSPIRQVASVQSISTDALEGIEDIAEAGAGYAGETATSGNTTTPTVGKWRIPVYTIDTEPKSTQQLLDDAFVDVETWLANKIGDKLGRFENAEFVAGATKIRGFTSYTGAADSGAGVTWGSIGYVFTGTNGDFGATTTVQMDKLIELMGTLKQAYLGNARWAAARAVITKIRKFKDGVGAYIWSPGGAGMPESIMNFPLTRMEDMPALATDSYSLAFGDFAAAYQIVDRQGIRTLRDPYTSKPYVKFYTTKRTGGGVVNFEAIKLMKFGTS